MILLGKKGAAAPFFVRQDILLVEQKNNYILLEEACKSFAYGHLP